MPGDVCVFPLSFAQERLWFLDRLVPGNPLYNIDASMRLRGPLDLDALSQAAAEIVRRHESLRTTVTAIDGHPYQVVADAVETGLAVVDLRDLDAPVREGRAA